MVCSAIDEVHKLMSTLREALSRNDSASGGNRFGAVDVVVVRSAVDGRSPPAQERWEAPAPLTRIE